MPSLAWTAADVEMGVGRRVIKPGANDLSGLGLQGGRHQCRDPIFRGGVGLGGCRYVRPGGSREAPEGAHERLALVIAQVFPVGAAQQLVGGAQRPGTIGRWRSSCLCAYLCGPSSPHSFTFFPLSIRRVHYTVSVYSRAEATQSEARDQRLQRFFVERRRMHLVADRPPPRYCVNPWPTCKIIAAPAGYGAAADRYERAEMVRLLLLPEGLRFGFVTRQIVAVRPRASFFVPVRLAWQDWRAQADGWLVRDVEPAVVTLLRRAGGAHSTAWWSPLCTPSGPDRRRGISKHSRVTV